MYNALEAFFGNSFLFCEVALLVLGLLIGSFLNVVIYRLPIMLEHKWHTDAKQILGQESDKPVKSINLLLPGSHCLVCKSSVPFWANVPLLSYLILGGRCFGCKARISPRYPAVELITGLLFMLAGYVSNDVLVLLGMLVFISFVICLVLIDYDTLILPDELTLLLMWLGILANLNGLFAGSLINSVVGATVGYSSLWLLYWGFKLLTGRDGMGYGDFKFLAAILAWTGYRGLIPVTLLASALGIIYFIIQRVMLKTSCSSVSVLSQELPFGPFLGGAGMVFLFAEHYFVFLALVVMQCIIGLTGLIGSGKSAVASMFKELGITVIDTDAIAHAVTAPGGVALVPIMRNFGSEFIAVDGGLDRSKMRQLVFADANKLAELERILHPFIFSATLEQIKVSSSRYAIVMVPLLFRALKYLKLIQRSVFVDCAEPILVERVVSRSGLTVSEVQNILKAQIPRELQLVLSDDVLDNNGTIGQLYEQVVKLNTTYQKLFSTLMEIK